MTYIPDPIELMQARCEDLAEQFNEKQQDVPLGSFRCPGCNVVHNYEPIQVSPSPDSPDCCYECLPDDVKAAYDQFEASIKNSSQ